MSRQNSAPAGWAPRRDRQRWSMGRIACVIGTAASSSEMTAVGVEPSDYVAGVIDLTTPGTTQANLDNVVVASNALTMSSGTPWTNARNYLIVLWRRQEDDRT